MLFICARGHVSLCMMNVTWTDLDLLAFFKSQFWVVAKLVCSFCEAMTGSLLVGSTTVLSAKVVVDSGVASIIMAQGYCFGVCPH
jgi:hypothetical protein